jgi:hypothetical protein
MPGEYDENAGQELIERAKAGDADAEGSLCGCAAGYLLSGEPMHPDLQRYIGGVLVKKLVTLEKRRKGRPTNWPRNFFILHAVHRLRRVGINPTRNEATRNKKCGCQIVAELLNGVGIDIDEPGVADVWRDRKNAPGSRSA